MISLFFINHLALKHSREIMEFVASVHLSVSQLSHNPHYQYKVCVCNQWAYVDVDAVDRLLI